MQHFVKDDGFNVFRLPVGWQYLTDGVLGGTIDEDNFAEYDALVQACLNTGASCIIDIHNYARWNGKVSGYVCLRVSPSLKHFFPVDYWPGWPDKRAVC